MQPATEPTTTEAIIDHAERQRRWLRRFSWTGFVLVLAAILFVGGHPLFIRWQLRQHGWNLQTPSHVGLPDWVPQWADPWLAKIDHASHYRSPLRLGDLELLRRLPDLESLVIESTDISAAQLEKFSQWPKLSFVEFNSVRLESAGLRHLATSPNLEAVNFFDTVLDDDAIEHISTCDKLKQLIVTGITDDHLRELSRLQRLTCLGLITPRMTDDALRRLPNELPGLELLVIRNATFSANALAECARRSKLRTVQLKNVPISDTEILEFQKCPTLQLLSLEASGVTAVGAEELRKSAPTLRVEIK